MRRQPRIGLNSALTMALCLLAGAALAAPPAATAGKAAPPVRTTAKTYPDVVRPAEGPGVDTVVVETFAGGSVPRRVEHYKAGTLVDVTHLYRDGKPQHVMVLGPGDETARVTVYFEGGKPHRSFTLVKGVTNGVMVTYDEEGVRRSELPHVDGKPEGTERRFDDQGRLQATSEWRGGLRDGPFITWYPGQPPRKETEIHYSAGVPASKGAAWWPSGNRKAVFQLLSGLKHGEETRYADDRAQRRTAVYRYEYGLLHGLAHTFWPSGDKRTQIPFVKGKAQGMERHWHENGQIAFEAKRVNDERHGTARLWNKEGRLIAALPYKNGVLDGNEFRFYQGSGAVRAVFVWKEGQLQGEARVWRDAKAVNKYGPLLARIPLKDGQIHGTEIRYREDGKTKWKEVERVKGVVEGKVTVYREDGTRERVMGYKAGEQDGRTLVFDEAGKVVIGEYHFTAGKKSGMARRWWANGQPQAEWPWADDGSGSERRWHEDGKIHFTVPLVNGKREGVQTVYAKAGWKWAERTWHDDKLSGEEKRFYKSGRVMGIYPVVDGKWHGKARVYAKRGGWLWAEQPYVEGLLHGTEVRFARNGGRFALFRWEKGKLKGKTFLRRRGGGKKLRDGRVVYYFEGTTNVRRELKPTPVKGQRVEILYWPNGAKRVVAPLLRGKRHGEATFYRDDDSVHARVTFVGGVREGSEVRYYASGEKHMEIPFKANAPVGYVRTYYRNGTVQSRYPAGKKPTGTEIQYHRNGAVRMTVPMVAGDRHGYARLQGPHGRRVARLSYAKGGRHGVEVHYHANGKKRMVVPVVKGERQGRAVIYTPEGRRWAEVPYRYGRRHGTERRFGPSGRHIIEERDYRDGVATERRSYVTRLRGAEPPPEPSRK